MKNGGGRIPFMEGLSSPLNQAGSSLVQKMCRFGKNIFLKCMESVSSQTSQIGQRLGVCALSSAVVKFKKW